jgi:hypothetical protein
MRKLLTLTALAMITAVSGTTFSSQAAAQAAQRWQIGPVVGSRNSSVGMPAQPTPAGRGWYFDFPYPHAGVGHVHYVTFDPGSVLGKSRIVVRYRVDASKGVRFVPQETPGVPGTVSLYLQRRGDNWSGRRHYEFFRWFAPPPTVRVLAPGVHEMTADLRDPNWISVMGRRSWETPEAFTAAKADTGRIGLVFGSSGARGHGVYATGPARFTLISFRMI